MVQVQVMLNNTNEEFYGMLTGVMYYMVKHEGTINHVSTDKTYDRWYFDFKDFSLADNFAKVCATHDNLLKVEMIKNYPVGTTSTNHAL